MLITNNPITENLITNNLITNHLITNNLKNITIMKKIALAFLQIFLICGVSNAQSASDVLRFSAVQNSSTARSLGVGNSMSVLGGDFSAISINPAGLAGFRSSDLTVSFGYSSVNNETKSILNQIPNERVSNKITFNNVGLVLASQPFNEGSNWKTSNFAVGLNKLANFKENVSYKYNDLKDRSLVRNFRDRANKGEFDPFGIELAFETGAIYEFTNNKGVKELGTDFDVEPFSSTYTQSTERSGYVNELVFAYAGTYKDKLSLGATIGVPFAQYEVNNIYNEVSIEKKSPFNSLNFKETYILDGTGVNLKIGAIYRPIQLLRLGLAIHTPTAYSFSDNSITELTYNYREAGVDKSSRAQSPDRNIQYALSTPWKFIGSAGFLFGKNGFLTAEVEYVDYRNGRLRFTQTDTISASDQQYLIQRESEINNDVKTELKSAINIRLGGEFAYDIFRLRAGVNILGATQEINNTARQIYTLGAGIRGKSIFLDLAYSYLNQNYSSNPELVGTVRPIAIDITGQKSNFVATLGFKF